MPIASSIAHTPTSPIAVRQGGGGLPLLLLDDFDRANTSPGDLGTPLIGAPWDLRAPADGSYPPMPASSSGQIVDEGFVTPDGATVYAFNELARTPKQIIADFSWVDDTVGTRFNTFAILCSSDPTAWVSHLFHLTVTNGVCTIQKRLSTDGSFVTLNTGQTTISPGLALGGTPHRIVVDVNNDTVRVRIDETRYDCTVIHADISAVMGKHLGFEHFNNGGTDVRWPLTIRGVEARG